MISGVVVIRESLRSKASPSFLDSYEIFHERLDANVNRCDIRSDANAAERLQPSIFRRVSFFEFRAKLICEVEYPKDDATRDHIRMHLSHVAEMFSAGDFDVPMLIHDTTPPGVPTMKKLHTEIHYRYQETDTGGKIVIGTANPKALKAVHEFLRFQISEHRTGDSTGVTCQSPFLYILSIFLTTSIPFSP